MLWSLVSDPLTLSSVLLSLLLLGVATLIARWSLHGFRQSKQSLREAASYVSVIVGALAPRIEALEEMARNLKGSQNTELANLRGSTLTLESGYQGLVKSFEEIIAQQKKILQELDELKSRPLTPTVTSITQLRTTLPEDAVIDRLTLTERRTLEILTEGPLPAPELGRRLTKSREHMARLMKRLYLEGYVDRETDRPPFRYKLNDKLRSSLGSSVSASPSEKT